MNEPLPCPIEADVIEKYLPHRYPFLLIDRVLDYQLEPEKVLTAVKNVTINEPFFVGHFPGNKVMPGVLIIEAMAQASGMLAHMAAVAHGGEQQLFYLVKVDKARFNRTVIPGDQLEMQVKQVRIFRGMGQYECLGLVNGKKVASCELLCAGR